MNLPHLAATIELLISGNHHKLHNGTLIDEGATSKSPLVDEIAHLLSADMIERLHQPLAHRPPTKTGQLVAHSPFLIA